MPLLNDLIMFSPCILVVLILLHTELGGYYLDLFFYCFDKLVVGFGFAITNLEVSTLVFCSFVWQIKKDRLLALGLLCGELGGISLVLSFSKPRWFHFGFVLCCLMN